MRYLSSQKPSFLPIAGSRYRSDEIVRRGGCFYVGLTLGTLTASLIQAGASSRLDRVNGLSQDRDGYTSYVQSPPSPSPFWTTSSSGDPRQAEQVILKEKDIQLAKTRLERAFHTIKEEPLTWRTFVKVGCNWKFWALLWVDIFF